MACLFAVSAMIGGAALAPSPAQALDLGKVKKQLEEKARERTQQKAATSGGSSQSGAPARPLAPSRVCDAAQTNRFCYAFTGTANADSKTEKGNQMACKLLKGRYAPSVECPAQNAFGRCTVLGGQPGEYVVFYYSGGKMTAAQAEQDCRNPKSGLHRQGAGSWQGQ